MTGLLKNVMTEKAATQAAPAIDLDAIVATGNKRIRRRRTARGLGIAALAAGLVATAVTVLPGADEPPISDGISSSFAERKVTWARTDVIHYGDRDIALGGHELVAFVQTDVGFVFADRSGDVFVANGTSIVKLGGGNTAFRLEADDTGNLVGWVDSSKPVPEFVVYDASTRREVARTNSGNEATDPEQAPGRIKPTVVGIDAGYAYLVASDGFRRLDLDSGANTMLRKGLYPDNVRDVTAGLFAITSQLSGDGGSVVVGDSATATAPKFAGWQADLSPDGRHLFTESADVPRVFRADSTTALPLAHPDHPLMILSQWLDNDRFVAVGIRDAVDKPQMQPVDLITCSFSRLSCEVSVPAFMPYPKDKAGFQLPDGHDLDS